LIAKAILAFFKGASAQQIRVLSLECATVVRIKYPKFMFLYIKCVTTAFLKERAITAFTS